MTTVAELLAKVELDTNDFVNGTNKIDKSLGKVDSSLDNTAKNVAKLVGGFIAFRTIQGFLSNATSAAADFEKSMVSLGIISERFGVNAEQAKKRAEELGRELRIGVGASAEGLQNLIKSGLSLDSAADLMKRFTNEAITGKSANITLADAVKNLSFAYTTGNSALGNMSGVSENFSNIQEKGAKIIDKYNQGLLTTSNTSADMLKFLEQVKNSTEAGGKAFSSSSEEMSKYVGMIDLTNQTMGSAEKFQGTLIDTQATLEQKMLDFNIAIGQKLMPVLNDFISQVLLPLATQAIPVVVEAFGKLIDFLKKSADGLGQLFGFLKDNSGFIAFGVAIMGAVSLLTGSLIPAIGSVVGAIFGLLGPIGLAVVGLAGLGYAISTIGESSDSMVDSLVRTTLALSAVNGDVSKSEENLRMYSVATKDAGWDLEKFGAKGKEAITRVLTTSKDSMQMAMALRKEFGLLSAEGAGRIDKISGAFSNLSQVSIRSALLEINALRNEQGAYTSDTMRQLPAIMQKYGLTNDEVGVLMNTIDSSRVTFDKFHSTTVMGLSSQQQKLFDTALSWDNITDAINTATKAQQTFASMAEGAVKSAVAGITNVVTLATRGTSGLGFNSSGLSGISDMNENLGGKLDGVKNAILEKTDLEVLRETIAKDQKDTQALSKASNGIYGQSSTTALNDALSAQSSGDIAKILSTYLLPQGVRDQITKLSDMQFGTNYNIQDQVVSAMKNLKLEEGSDTGFGTVAGKYKNVDGVISVADYDPKGHYQEAVDRMKTGAQVNFYGDNVFENNQEYQSFLRALNFQFA